MIKKSVLVLLLFTSFTSSHASRGPFYLLNFMLGAARYSPEVGNSSVFVQLGWTPLLEIGESGFGIRGELSVSSCKDPGGSRFMTTNYEGFGIIPLGSIFYFEAGGGMENWHGDHGGMNPIITVGLFARIGEFVDRLYLNLSHYQLEGNGTKIWRAGYCFNF